MKEEDIKKLIDKLQYFDYDKLLNKIRKNVKKPSVLVTGGNRCGEEQPDQSPLRYGCGEDRKRKAYDGPYHPLRAGKL